VAQGFNRINLANSGFALLAFTDSVKPGVYELGLAIKDAGGRFVYQTLRKEVKVNKSEFAGPVRLNKLATEGKIICDVTVEEDAISYSTRGWAAIENQDADSSIINLVLKDGENIYVLPTEPFPRPDVTASFKNRYKLDNSGYGVKFLKASLPKGTYRIGLLIQDLRHRTETIFFTEKQISNY
ncbi:MAG TPA: hypothetical protein VJ765_14795, partial [Chitinophagaceae bacterium]|nr:hypothetical protein [Chitinophagaceae bacterium]